MQTLGNVSQDLHGLLLQSIQHSASFLDDHKCVRTDRVQDHTMTLMKRF